MSDPGRAEPAPAGQGTIATIYGLRASFDRGLSLPPLQSDPVFGEIQVLRSDVPRDWSAGEVLEIGSGHASHMSLETDGRFAQPASGDRMVLRVSDDWLFHWVVGTRKLFYGGKAADQAKDFSFWCVHLVIPIFMVLEGIAQVIHAGAVAHDDEALVFLAPSMGGKSTLVDEFLRQGHALISDDKVPFIQQNGRWCAVPSHPFHRPYRAAMDMGKLAQRTRAEPVPISSVYCLRIRDDIDEISIEPVKGRVAVALLLENHLFQLPALRAQGLVFLSQVANGLSMFSLSAPRDLDRLEEVYETILAHQIQHRASNGS